MNVWEIIEKSYSSYARYLWREMANPSWHNYFYWLIGVSLFFLLMEWWRPWREEQPKFRKDFWLDFFYMFFNFFLFSLIIYNAASNVVVYFFNDLIITWTGFDLQASNPLQTAPLWVVLLVGFIVRDFVQWWTHRLLHRFEFLWEFHKVHHSVEQMGFAAHLRYHWMETIVYRTIEYIPLALLGIGLYDFFMIHIFTLAVGHYNHSNITVPARNSGAIFGAFIGVLIAVSAFDIALMENPSLLAQLTVVATCTLIGAFAIGPFMKIIFNSPEMHIWHHAHDMPDSHRYGINFGLTLAIWDYIWKTAYVPHSGRDIPLGFPGLKQFPKTFWAQATHGFSKPKR
ncbi:MAG TPA: sterol desaturase family protein [Saprospiraceae bacterium]|nr:sterol desaturase family protein [Saprospiraceae bacterium]HMQ84805.1 sterol desaturase family protein [Saprospiraceae bacterium]